MNDTITQPELDELALRPAGQAKAGDSIPVLLRTLAAASSAESGMVAPAVPDGYDPAPKMANITTSRLFTTEINLRLVFVAAGSIELAGQAVVPVPAGFTIYLPGTEANDCGVVGTNIIATYYTTA
jgi:hypothetical protein